MTRLAPKSAWKISAGNKMSEEMVMYGNSNMTDQNIQQLANKYREAIEAARDDGRFSADISFNNFPRGCCGDTSYLLAVFLRGFDIETIWYSAERGYLTHAWLVVKDERVKKPTPKSFLWPEEPCIVFAGYGVETVTKEGVITRYEEADLRDGLIIDITADRFDDYDTPVYVGVQDSFHQSFDFNQAHDCEDKLGNQRLYGLYGTISEYL